MTTIAKTPDMPLAENKILNAKRYGISEKDLSQFMALMKNVEKKAADVQAEPQAKADDGEPQLSTKDFIKDYVKQRMTDRMAASLKDSQYLGAGPVNFDSNPQDFILDMMGGGERPKSNNVSGLLNMHFDLNTLQMLS